MVVAIIFRQLYLYNLYVLSLQNCIQLSNIHNLKQYLTQHISVIVCNAQLRHLSEQRSFYKHHIHIAFHLYESSFAELSVKGSIQVNFCSTEENCCKYGAKKVLALKYKNVLLSIYNTLYTLYICRGYITLHYLPWVRSNDLGLWLLIKPF